MISLKDDIKTNLSLDSNKPKFFRPVFIKSGPIFDELEKGKAIINSFEDYHTGVAVVRSGISAEDARRVGAV